MLETFHIELTGSHPRNFGVHKGSHSHTNPSTGTAVVNAVNVQQAYKFCHMKKYANSEYGVGILSMHFYKFDGVLEMNWDHRAMVRFMADREWAKKEYASRVEEINEKNEHFKWEGR